MSNFKRKCILIFTTFLWCHSAALAAESCKPGYIYDGSSLNRCVLSQATVETKSNALGCGTLKGNAYKECFKKNVDKQVKKAEDTSEIDKQGNAKKRLDSHYTIASLMSIGSAYTLYKSKTLLGKCSSTSMWLMLGAGVSTLIGEFATQKIYENKVNALADKYKSKIKESDKSDYEKINAITENQKIAFDFQIEQEVAQKEAHQARRATYILVTGLYTASSIAAIYEGFSVVGGTPCSFSSTAPEAVSTPSSSIFKGYEYLTDLNSQEFLEIILRKISHIFINDAIALTGKSMAITTAISLSSIYASGVAKISTPFIQKAVQSPYSRAVAAGLLAGYTGKVAYNANALVSKADERITFIEEIRSNFLKNGGSTLSTCTQEDRDLSTVPGCYCYRGDGSVNSSRSEQKSCKNYLSSAQSRSLKATNYNLATGANQSAAKGCFDKSDAFDPKCKCKQKKGSNAKDSCFRINGRIKLGALSTLSGAKGLIRDTSNFIQGSISTAELDGIKTNQLIAKIRKKEKQLSKTKKLAPLFRKIKKDQLRVDSQVGKSITKGLKNGSIKNPLPLALSSEVKPTSPESILKNFEKSIKRKKSLFKKGKNKPSSNKGNALADYGFNDNSNASAGIKIDSIASVMKKNYNFNDINDHSHNNIFKIITNRYQRSALRRLFDDNGLSQADKANETDVNQQ